MSCVLNGNPTATGFFAYCEQQQRFIRAPVFVSRTNGSTLFEAIDFADASWSHSKILELATRTDALVVVSDVPDNCRAVRRCKTKVADLFADIPNILYDEFAGCACHKLHNIMTRTVGEEAVVGNVHAVSYVLGVAQRRNQLWQATEN